MRPALKRRTPSKKLTHEGTPAQPIAPGGCYTV